METETSQIPRDFYSIMVMTIPCSILEGLALAIPGDLGIVIEAAFWTNKNGTDLAGYASVVKRIIN